MTTTATSTPTLSGLEILQLTPATCTAVWENVLLSVWREQPMTSKDLTDGQALILARAARAPGGKLAMLMLMDDRAQIPSSEVRRTLDAGAAKLMPLQACHATVFRGTGFKAAVVRGILTSVAMLSRQSFDQQVFATTEAAIPWLVPYARNLAGPSVTVEGLSAAVGELLGKL